MTATRRRRQPTAEHPSHSLISHPRDLAGALATLGWGAPKGSAPSTTLDPDALKTACRLVYAAKARKRGRDCIGWDYERDEVKEQWLEEVENCVSAYLAALPVPLKEPTGVHLHGHRRRPAMSERTAPRADESERAPKRDES